MDRIEIELTAHSERWCMHAQSCRCFPLKIHGLLRISSRRHVNVKQADHTCSQHTHINTTHAYHPSSGPGEMHRVAPLVGGSGAMDR